MQRLELSLEQITETLQGHTEGEIETLEIMASSMLKQELKERWKMGKKELVDNKTLSKEELFMENECIP